MSFGYDVFSHCAPVSGDSLSYKFTVTAHSIDGEPTHNSPPRIACSDGELVALFPIKRQVETPRGEAVKLTSPFLTAPEVLALSLYSFSGSNAANLYLAQSPVLDGFGEDVKCQAKNVAELSISALKKLRLDRGKPVAQVLYRGLHTDAMSMLSPESRRAVMSIRARDDFRGYGDYVAPCLQSFSRDAGVAVEFSQRVYGEEKVLLMAVGDQGVNTQTITCRPEEQPVMFPPGAQFRVWHVQKDADEGMHIAHMVQRGTRIGRVSTLADALVDENYTR